MQNESELSPKGQQTREHIFETARDLFLTRGYDETTMRDIATTADISLGLTYHYFARKEDLVMELYVTHARAMRDYVDKLPAGQMVDRYDQVIRHALTELTPYRTAIMALFGTAMNPASGLSLMGTDDNPLSILISENYRNLVLESEDALRDPKAQHMGVTLYTFHMLILLFWLYDRSPEQSASLKLISFVYEIFKAIRPLFMFPMIPNAIGKLAGIMLPMSEKN